jgi:hypothetical protein
VIHRVASLGIVAGLVAIGGYFVTQPASIEEAVLRDSRVLAIKYVAEHEVYEVTVPEDMPISEARALGCSVVRSALDRFDSPAFFAVYTPSRRILSSWIPCV